MIKKHLLYLLFLAVQIPFLHAQNHSLLLEVDLGVGLSDFNRKNQTFNNGRFLYKINPNASILVKKRIKPSMLMVTGLLFHPKGGQKLLPENTVLRLNFLTLPILAELELFTWNENFKLFIDGGIFGSTLLSQTWIIDEVSGDVKEPGNGDSNIDYGFLGGAGGRKKISDQLFLTFRFMGAFGLVEMNASNTHSGAVNEFKTRNWTFQLGLQYGL